jgi:hypothetical protein
MLGFIVFVPRENYNPEKSIFEIKDDVKDEGELRNKILFKVHNTLFNDDDNLWEFYFLENYQEDKSILVMKFHHVFSDGSGLMSLFSYWSGKSME